MTFCTSRPFALSDAVLANVVIRIRHEVPDPYVDHVDMIVSLRLGFVMLPGREASATIDRCGQIAAHLDNGMSAAIEALDNEMTPN